MSAPTVAEIFTLPPARVVWGSLYKAQTTDQDGKPLITKSGANMGKPQSRWSFGVAVPKEPGKQWYETAWGQVVAKVGQAGFQNGQWQRPDFAWKVTDGDSAVPNKKGKAPNASPQNHGCWIIGFTTYLMPPPIYRRNNPGEPFQQVVGEDGFIKAGYYVEVNAEVKPNTGESPGLYWSPRMVAFVGYGPEIQQGPDASTAGFGQTALPAGASAAPIGGFMPASPTNPGMMAMPGQQMTPAPIGQVAPMQMPGQGMQPMQAPQQGMQVPATGAPQPLPLTPHTAILGLQAAPQQGMQPMQMPGQAMPMQGMQPAQMPAQAMQPMQMPVQAAPHGMMPQAMQPMQMPGQAMPMQGMQPAQMPGQMMQAPQHQPQRQMTALASGATYEQFMAMGTWNDQMLLDRGLMVIQ